jgi:hypothetical protein
MEMQSDDKKIKNDIQIKFGRKPIRSIKNSGSAKLKNENKYF